MDDMQRIAQAASNNTDELIAERDYLLNKVEALASLIDVSYIINSTAELDQLMRLVMEKAQDVMKSEASSVMMVNAEKNVLEFEIALGDVGDKMQKIELAMGEGIAGWVAENGEPQLIADVRTDSRFSTKADDSTGFETRSILAAPLIAYGRVIGVAEVINRVDGKSFDEDDLALFSTFCRQVALAIENARVRKLELESNKMEQQLEAAKFIQQSFMPESLPASPDHPFEVAASSMAAASVGGDFYDFVDFGDQRFGMAVGDVSGKGIPAALFMARLVSDFRLYNQRYSDPDRLLTALNQIFHTRSLRGMFVTFQYLIADTASGEVTVASAGHLPCIRVRASDGKAEAMPQADGIPLGVVPEYHFEQKQFHLSEGDFLVMISDGVIDAKNNNGEVYDFKRLLEVLTNPPASAEELLKRVSDDIHKYSNGSSQHDDLTIVVYKWR